MNKKQIRAIVIVLQLFLIASLFLPAGNITGIAKSGDNSLSVFGMIDRYAGMGFSDDALFYMILACVFPTAVIFFSLFLKERRNYSTAIVLCALYATASACFFSAAKRKMVDYATLTRIPYVIIAVSLCSMLLLILCFLYAAPSQGDGEDKIDKHQS